MLPCRFLLHEKLLIEKVNKVSTNNITSRLQVDRVDSKNNCKNWNANINSHLKKNPKLKKKRPSITSRQTLQEEEKVRYNSHVTSSFRRTKQKLVDNGCPFPGHYLSFPDPFWRNRNCTYRDGNNVHSGAIEKERKKKKWTWSPWHKARILQRSSNATAT